MSEKLFGYKEYISKYTSWNVMVEITRSQVLWEISENRWNRLFFDATCRFYWFLQSRCLGRYIFTVCIYISCLKMCMYIYIHIHCIDVFVVMDVNAYMHNSICIFLYIYLHNIHAYLSKYIYIYLHKHPHAL